MKERSFIITMRIASCMLLELVRKRQRLAGLKSLVTVYQRSIVVIITTDPEQVDSRVTGKDSSRALSIQPTAQPQHT